MTSGASTIPVRDAGWILIGALAGTGLCFHVSGGVSAVDTSHAVTFASLAVHAMLFGSLYDPIDRDLVAHPAAPTIGTHPE